jgi:hypothetical protein
MAESEAEALGANWFTDRDSGDFAGGPVRIFFAQPTTTRVSTDKRFFTNDGRSYFPVQNYGLTASQMAFNRQGSFYFLDVTVRAESTGDSFNVGPGDISGVEEVPGVVKVANLTSFITGDPAETNEEYISRVEAALPIARLRLREASSLVSTNEFDSVRAVQIIGAGDEGMDRDVLTGTGQGFLHLAGEATIFGDWIFLYCHYRDDGPTDSVTPQPGDILRFHPTTPAPPATVVVEAKVDYSRSWKALLTRWLSIWSWWSLKKEHLLF